MVAIIDYGVGNLFSLESSFKAIGEKTVITSDKDTIKKADSVILPGVGAFEDAIKKLNESGLRDFIIDLAKSDKPIMGICLGMQLLFDKSYEYGEHNGLGLISGEVCPIKDNELEEIKIPHMGWNSLEFTKNSEIFKYVENGAYVYFVHSYYAKNCDKNTIALTNYSKPLTAAVQNGNVFGCQFHPEKSGGVGLKILKAFCEIKEGKL